ncbi:MAG: pyrimidine 5'-nucleotidase [Candidatus Binatia bacterium]
MGRFSVSVRMPPRPETLFFDLDNTLYPRRLGVVDRIDRRINEYMRTRLRIDDSDVDSLRRRFWAEHGTTLRGLEFHHAVNPDEYLEYVHDIEITDLLKPDPALRTLLERLPGRKAVFSNASRAHAARVLGLLDLEGVFAAVLGLEDLGYMPKPVDAAYRLVLSRFGATAADSALIDDTRTNLAPAKRLGMRTFWVSDTAGDDGRDDWIDHVVASVHEIEAILA